MIEDEGIEILDGAIRYLAARAEADAHEQLTGEYEAFCILDQARHSLAVLARRRW